MSKLMLIDSTHPEETRVAVVSKGQIEDFDFEARHKRQLRGNIYLAKITRVEPSLQAAFVDYGGNRHGFLAFSEIHPDYYQIPQADREALLAEAAAEEEKRRARYAEDDADQPTKGAAEASDDHEGENAAEASDDGEPAGDEEEVAAEPAASADSEEDEDVDTEAVLRRQASIFQRKYRIQEVIRPRQVVLIQVVKEERGNKGAALTTYLSLAGRYCVLMPNTARSGGVSRKITSAADRKRLKAITSEFDIPRGAGLIVRTAGAKRTKTEVRRDFEYLTSLWKQIVARTMESTAPCLIHEEGHLVLRAVRDLYDKDIQQIIVEGEDAYNEAKNFVKLLMPTHASKVVQHTEGPPLFVASGVEDQLDSIFSPTVRLPSGGYIVINQTEALVAIDVNSGKATRERNVENTALKTNLEAASEACRQMRLRDLAGLIVIDFIDMEENRNNRAVEKRMAESLKIDRARVQTGRISQFGLFEISRQRRRAGVLELTSEPCATCDGTGRVRSVESAALQVLRLVEARAADDKVDTVQVQAPSDVAIYILNEKRSSIAEIEKEYNVSVRIEADSEISVGEFKMESLSGGKAVSYKPMKSKDFGKMISAIEADPEDVDAEEEDETDAEADDDEADEGSRRKRRGRRGGRRRRAREEVTEADGSSDVGESDKRRNDKSGRGRNGRSKTPDIALDGGEMLDAIASAPFLPPEAAPESAVEEQTTEQAEAGGDAETTADSSADTSRRRRPRRRRRGGQTEASQEGADGEEVAEAGETSEVPDVTNGATRTGNESQPVAEAAPTVEEDEVTGLPEPTPDEPEAAPAEAEAAEVDLAAHPLHGQPSAAAEQQPDGDAPKKPRMGWWNRRKAG